MTSGIRASVKHDFKLPTEQRGVQEKELEVWRDTAKICEKSPTGDPSCNPYVSGRVMGEESEGSDTSQLDKKIVVEAGLSSLNRCIVVVEKNFSSLESIALKGLDDVKKNLVDLDEVHKEGFTDLELKLTEALSSIQREFKYLKRQVDETAEAGVASPMNIRGTRIEPPKHKEFRG